jgi:uncharacterized membrane protein
VNTASEAVPRPVEAASTSARAAAASAAGRVTTTAKVVYSVAAVYAVVFALAAVSRHLEYLTAMFDLGNMTQAVWNTAHGHFLGASTPWGEPYTRLGVHVDPFLLLFVPLWLVWPSPLMLLALQAVAVAAGALPVFWLARKHLGSERAAAQFAGAYLLFPATQFNAFTVGSGVHPVSFAIPLLLFAIWFLDEDRLLPFAVFALLAASTKEEMPLVVGCLGLWYALRRGRRLGFAIFGIGLALTALDFFVIIPHFAPAGFDPFGNRYASLGRTPGGILHTAVTHPLRLVESLASVHKLVYLVLLLVPFLGLWLLEPLLLLGAAPDLAINLLSSKGDQTSIVFHWTAGIVPFVVAASVLGAKRLKRHAQEASLYVLAATASIAVFSPFLLGVHDLGRALPSNPDHAAAAGALRLIPGSVAVSASNRLAGHLAERRRVLVFPYVRDARWVVVDEHDYTNEGVAGFRRRIASLRRSPSWHLVYSVRGIDVFRR